MKRYGRAAHILFTRALSRRGASRAPGASNQTGQDGAKVGVVERLFTCRAEPNQRVRPRHVERSSKEDVEMNRKRGVEGID